MKIYLSASIVNKDVNRQIASRFEAAGCEVFLPQDITPLEMAHDLYPRHVFETCLREMERSDLGLLVLDAYGKDSAWESGWYEAKGKPMIGWVEGGLHFLRDWMVKSGLEAVLTTNPVIFASLVRDPILNPQKVFLIEAESDLARALREVGQLAEPAPCVVES